MTFAANKVYKFVYNTSHAGDYSTLFDDIAFIADGKTGETYQTAMATSCFQPDQVVDWSVTISVSSPPIPSQPEYYSNKIKAFAGVFLGFCCIAIVLNMVCPIFFKTPNISAYSVLFYFQCLIMTPLLGIPMHVEVKRFFEYLNFVLFNFSFLPDGVIFVDDNSTRPRHLMEQRNEYLDMIGLESGSALYDLGKLIFVSFLVLGVYFLVAACMPSQSGISKAPKLPK